MHLWHIKLKYKYRSGRGDTVCLMNRMFKTEQLVLWVGKLHLMSPKRRSANREEKCVSRSASKTLGAGDKAVLDSVCMKLPQVFLNVTTWNLYAKHAVRHLFVVLCHRYVIHHLILECQGNCTPHPEQWTADNGSPVNCQAAKFSDISLNRWRWWSLTVAICSGKNAWCSWRQAHFVSRKLQVSAQVPPYYHAQQH